VLAVTLSVIIITKNEEAAIGRCLESVAWADEIIVFDCGSTDRTVEISRSRGGKVTLTGDWPGFGPQKNRALSETTGDWVLSIDADEWVSPSLTEEIRQAINEPESNSAFEIPRLSSFCGRFMRHAGWRPDYVLRLFRRGYARFTEDRLHERVIADGRVGRLKGTLLHESFPDMEDVLDKLNRYSTVGAAMLREKGRRSGLVAALGHGMWTFLKTYFLHAGFLDGREGFMLSVSNAEGAYYKYVKLMLLARQKDAGR
jgi:glycosyltransferase involved in cell wall biosynthesis